MRMGWFGLVRTWKTADSHDHRRRRPADGRDSTMRIIPPLRGRNQVEGAFEPKPAASDPEQDRHGNQHSCYREWRKLRGARIAIIAIAQHDDRAYRQRREGRHCRNDKHQAGWIKNELRTSSQQ